MTTNFQWKDFRDLFKSIIYDKGEISPIKQMQYIKSVAIEVIGKIKLDAESYQVA